MASDRIVNSWAAYPLRWAGYACLFSGLAQAAELKDLGFGAAGWMQFGQIVHSTDTAEGVRLDGRPMISSGAQISLRPKLSEKLSISAGVGVGAGHNLPHQIEPQEGKGYPPMGVGPYVAEANFTYTFTENDFSAWSLRGGWFPYEYSDAENLGMYLLRGPVYPGLLLSGFETKHTLPVANTLGFQLHHRHGKFQQDLLLTVETEFYPYYDLSPAYLASYSIGPFQFGGGVNLYHLIPVDNLLTNDTNVVYVDTVSVNPSSGQPVLDTIPLSFQGTKVMAHFSFQPQALMEGANWLTPDDLKLYGEIALLGLGNEGYQKKLYGGYAKRMPVMVGFNIPTFRLLDRFAVEVEWYGADFRDDLARNEHTAGNEPSPLPLRDSIPITRDNWKWSFHGSRMIEQHVKFSFQLASDHFRPGVFRGYGDNNPPTSSAAFRGLDEWYWMTKLAYFF